MSYLPTLVQAGLGRSLLVVSLLTALIAGTSVLTALQARRLPPTVPTWALMATALVVLAGAARPYRPVGRLWDWSSVARPGHRWRRPRASRGRQRPGRPSERRQRANNTTRYLASAVGVTVVALLAPAGRTPDAAALVGGWTTAAVVTAAVSLVGAGSRRCATARARRSAVGDATPDSPHGHLHGS